MPHTYNHTEPNRQMTKPTKKGMKRVSPKKKKKGTHKMPDGTVMSGKKHNKDSKPVKKKKMKPMGKVKKTISY